ncbi:AGAP000657-PA-like protein [Anopheles sinensis]|uniref:AGAP000657-PA-like protein n=1 Tax=Anopheles sinensis TaxID=74873 RepID=A0A084VAB9_ANOSI|nr:AGAP000657-PA-like protein [Anopheles sinensis]
MYSRCYFQQILIILCVLDFLLPLLSPTPDGESFYPELEEEEGHVTVQLLSLPHERFVRNIAKTEMDMFIALGGLIGLFFGMSLLTTIDFLINLCSLSFGLIYRRRWPTLALAMVLGALTSTLR